eukprot:TRINITY_DN24111_c0_g2_i4.p1 TRINITY_DN24111_c0_g2~~TRINITY_DN24111_c0_g2_i4.p1  ORF type:complete len:140 (+),score=23.51 TRINITY_DN24111_c0_g2_i4:45-422(+)
MTATKIAAFAGAALGLAAMASATVQPNTYEIRVSNVVSPGMPSATVEVWADWDSDLFYAFAAAEWSLRGDGTGDFSGPSSAFTDPGQDDGTPSGGDVGKKRKIKGGRKKQKKQKGKKHRTKVKKK